MPKKKKFIDKKNAISFYLVHRSQKDPLIVDETAPQHVLLESKSQKNKEEEHKYGIFFDDDYDYMQHLKNASEDITVWEAVDSKSTVKIKSCVTSKKKINLPSSVFASEVEEPIGLLNKAAPVNGLNLDLDPDIVAALDDDFDFEDPNNELEDNFMELANKENDADYSDEYGSEIEDDVGSLDNDFNFEKEEVKSKFSNYSLTSSVIRRNEQLTLLDNRFEKMFEDYQESAIGALDCEEIEGGISTEEDILQRLADVSFANKTEEDINIKEKILKAAAHYDSCEEEIEEIIVQQDDKKWDCESILSTYSNLYNHPAKITVPKMGPPKIKVHKKTGIPVNVLHGNKLTAEALAQLEQVNKIPGPKSIISQISELSIRPKNESPDDRKVRKQNLKLFRRERRIEKKANVQAFKEEKIKQEKVLLNFRNNQRGIKKI